VGHHRFDDRLVGWADIMPTLLDLAGLAIPESVEGQSMVGDKKRDTLYGECSEGENATRMIHDGRHKLIYYPVGNHTQLFDLQTDPRELNDLSASTDHAATKQKLTDQLIVELYGGDETWVQQGKLVGLPDETYEPKANRGLSGQRGSHWPVPPQTGQAGPPIQHN
jgi:arylsulfatase A-like enzyme